VLHAIYGADPKDASTVSYPFNYSPAVTLKGMKIGYFKNDFDKDSSVSAPFNNATLEWFKKQGALLVPLELPALPVNDMSILLLCEAASAFDELTLSNTDDQMVQQRRDRWPNYFRAAHFIPATEYIRANRLRWKLIQQMEEQMNKVSICIAPSLSGDNLLVTNLTGHPSIVVPNGFSDPKTPVSIVFTGQLYDEGTLIAVTKKYQDATGFHKSHPPRYSGH
jgi:Asp-tRNA(Asn)/Glu-tRNA(Gln) amidotransferase A subunit family amidase